MSHATMSQFASKADLFESLHACYRSGQIEISEWVQLKAEHPELSDFAIEANLKEVPVAIAAEDLGELDPFPSPEFADPVDAVLMQLARAFDKLADQGGTITLTYAKP